MSLFSLLMSTLLFGNLVDMIFPYESVSRLFLCKLIDRLTFHLKNA